MTLKSEGGQMAPPEEAAPAEDTPLQSDSPQGTPDASESTDWEQRYKDVQAQYTKTSQEASELRQYREAVDALQSENPQERDAAAEALGLTFVDEGGSEEEDPNSVLARRLEAVETFLATGQEEAAVEAMQSQDIDHINQALTGLETRIKRDLTESEVQLLASHAILNRTEEGPPGIDEAIQLYEDMNQTHDKRWAQSKRVSTPSVGQEAVETPSLDSHSDRVASMMERFEANQ